MRGRVLPAGEVGDPGGEHALDREVHLLLRCESLLRARRPGRAGRAGGRLAGAGRGALQRAAGAACGRPGAGRLAVGAAAGERQGERGERQRRRRSRAIARATWRSARHTFAPYPAPARREVDLPDHLRRQAGRDRARGQVLGNHGVRADHAALPDRDPARDHAVDPEPAVVADPHRALRGEALVGEGCSGSSKRWAASPTKQPLANITWSPISILRCAASITLRLRKQPLPIRIRASRPGLSSSPARAGSPRRSSGGRRRAPPAALPRPGSGRRSPRGRHAG